MSNEKQILAQLEQLEQQIMAADIPDAEKNKMIRNFLKLKEQKINLMIAGAPSCGKDATLNTLFNAVAAAMGVDPKTMYEMGKLILWDSLCLDNSNEA